MTLASPSSAPTASAVPVAFQARAVIGCYTDWTPLVGRSELFPETIDTSDPWQFSNVLVN